MTLIAMSVAVMLAPSIVAPASQGVGGTAHPISLPLPLVVDGEPSSSFVGHVVDEAARIWSPLGIRLIWIRDSAASVEPAPLRVVIGDAASANPDHLPIGWIHFARPDAPESMIYLSRATARLLLSSAPAVRHEPIEWQQLLLARVLGRALAHEVGHYLLQSDAHTPRGLMRPQWPLDLLIADSRAPFVLDGPERARVAMRVRTLASASGTTAVPGRPATRT